MNGLPYYKAYPRDFIEGTVGMSFELKGAYRLVLDLIYMQGGNLPDDERYISGLLGCTIRKWKSLRSELVSGGKVQVNGEFLTNERAVSELKTLRKLTEKQSENRSNPNKNKVIKSPSFNHTDTEATLSSVATAPSEKHAGVFAQPALPGASGEIDFTDLASKIDRAADGKIHSSSLLVLGPVMELITAGASVDIDILPAVRATASRSENSYPLAYHIPAMQKAFERRVKVRKQLPAPVPFDDSDDGWARRLRVSRFYKNWCVQLYGPMPGRDGCKAPAHLLIDGDGVGWRDQDKSEFSSMRRNA